MKKSFTMLIPSLILSFAAHAQQLPFQVQNIRISAGDTTVSITYDLNDSRPGQQFDIQLFLNIEQGNRLQLREVSGDVGNNVVKGLDKKIIWNFYRENIDLGGNVQFEIQAQPELLPLELRTNFAGQKFRKGQVLSLNWVGGTSRVSLLLKRNGDLAETLDFQFVNEGAKQVRLPKDIAAGTGYEIMLSSTNSPDVTTGSFQVKNKIPRYLYGIPVVAVIGGFLLLGKADGSSGEDDLPPPDPSIFEIN